MAFLIAIITGGYALLVGFLGWQLRRRKPSPARLLNKEIPQIAVLVAARNEEHNLPRCLDALLAQDIPRERLTIVVADDHSTDDTEAVIQKYERETVREQHVAGSDPAHHNLSPSIVRYVRVPKPENDLRGKAQAIHEASKAAPEAEILLITDADCAPEPTWARWLTSHLAEDRVALVCGFTLPDAEHATLVDEIQKLDWAFLLGLTAAVREVGFPSTGMGNNMGLRREAYEAVGGYPALPFSVTEDYELCRAIDALPDWTSRFRIERESYVATLPMPTFRGAYNQRSRWARGGLGRGLEIVGIYAVMTLAHLLPLIGLVVAPLVSVLALGAKWFAEFSVLQALRRRVGKPRFRLRSFFAFEAFMTFYTITLPLDLLLHRRIRWKGRKW